MGKALAYRVGVGLQFGHGWKRHQQLEDSFTLMGDYHELIALDRRLPIFPAIVRSYLKEPDNEAVLSRAAGWNFIRTDYAEREITLDREGRATLDIDNPFEAQPLQLELRPDFDYVGPNDRNNITVADSTTLGRAKITTNHDIPGITDRLCKRFESSHKVERIEAETRKLSDLSIKLDVDGNTLEDWIQEARPDTQCFLFLVPNS